MIESNNVLTIKTTQCRPFRDMINAIKDILSDFTITFDKKKGIKICSMDNTHTILVNIELEAIEFEVYNCEFDKIIISVNAKNLFKVLEPMSNNDTLLTMYIEKVNYHEGIVSHLGLQYLNADIKQYYTQKLKLNEPDTEELFIPDVEYSTIIKLPTVDFKKIVHDLSGVSDRVEIKLIKLEEVKLIFKCTGSFTSSEIIRLESDGYMEFIQKSDVSKEIPGTFSLGSLSKFIKCTPLCTYLEMYLKNDFPLTIKYNVGNLGTIKLCLSPLPSV